MEKFNTAATIQVCTGKNERSLYEHQTEAMLKLNEINRRAEFNSLLVLPTGGGKTLTAATWLMKNATDKGKKILWIAHRHLLLEQSAEAFRKNAYAENLINYSNFKYRVISGKHDKPRHIKPDDDVLIVSKDSIVRNLDVIKNWIGNDKEIYCVIDEAHHATAKSYRKIIDYLKLNTERVKLLGLTATPFRTASEEAGLLKKIFTDDIVYKVDLTELIKKEILSRPIFEECDTKVEIGENLGLNALKSIEYLDNLPEDVANEIANSSKRNKLIVSQYLNNKDKYEQTLVFAVNRLHAFTLKSLFEKAGVPSGVIVSGTTAEFIGIDISNEENEKNVEAYRNGQINVLINVNILTEGVDLPQTKTVFLTRPTVSSILMTQMIGRALRGKKAGGTEEAFIVSFIDDWNDRIAWVNPERLLEEESDFNETASEYTKKTLMLISIAKIEEFAKMMDETVDTCDLETVDAIKRIPLGMYAFSFLDCDNMERNHQVLVYDSTKEQYELMIGDLEDIFKEYGIQEESIEEGLLDELCLICRNTYFSDDMIPTYDSRDIRYILKYFAQKECAPSFIAFSELERSKLDVSAIAKHIHAEDMRMSQKRQYLDDLWETTEELKIYYNKKLFFLRQVDIELDKLDGLYVDNLGPNFIEEAFDYETRTLYEISKVNPAYARNLRDEVFSNHINKNGEFVCAGCGKKSKSKGVFQVDHIMPFSKGGLTKNTNLQLLCRNCNQIKGDKYVPDFVYSL